MSPRVFHAWFSLRQIKWRLKGIPVEAFKQPERNEQVEQQVIPYSLRKAERLGSFDRVRSERLINIVRTVGNLDVSSAKILSVGPRSEFELMLLNTYGFRWSNIESIDLVSYSPLIKLMDMNNMSYGDNEFDIIFSAYTVRYSTDLQKTCDEIVRCIKPNGLVAIVFATEVKRGNDTAEHTEAVASSLRGGIEELLLHFDGQVTEILWREEYVPVDAPDKNVCSIVFRVRG